jgi:hypothetical protein
MEFLEITKLLRVDFNNMLHRLKIMMDKEITINKEILFKKLINCNKMVMMF